MEITAYRLRPDLDWPLRPAAPHRSWMDAFPDRWPYRCLPMVMANQGGWEVACPVEVEARWDGGAEVASLQVEFDGDRETWAWLIGSHFGSGVLTFALPYLFRTPQPVGLWVRGPSNAWVEGAQPLEGWVETWASEAPFTMNWKLTTPGRSVRFRRDDPICLIQPFDLDRMEQARPVVRDLSSNPDLQAAYERWRGARFAFGAVRSAGDSQHAYTRGFDGAGRPLPAHRTRLRLPPFDDPASPEG